MRVIIECILTDPKVDTTMVTRADMWLMALDIAKKRESYLPHKKKKTKRNVKRRQTFDVQAVAATAAAAASTASTTEASTHCY